MVKIATCVIDEGGDERGEHVCERHPARSYYRPVGRRDVAPVALDLGLALPCRGRARRPTKELILEVARRRFARARLRGHEPQRHRRRGRHPAAEPAAPLPVEGGALPRGRSSTRSPTGSGSSTRRPKGPREGWPQVERMLRAAFTLLRGPSRLRPARALGGARGRPDPPRRARRAAAAAVRPRRRVPRAGDGRRPAAPLRRRASCCSPATARCSRTSPTCRSSPGCSTPIRSRPRHSRSGASTSSTCSAARSRYRAGARSAVGRIEVPCRTEQACDPVAREQVPQQNSTVMPSIPSAP